MSEVVTGFGLSVVEASGLTIVDESGRSFLDMTSGSGVLALGHGHPEVIEAAQRQLRSFAHGGWQFATPARAALTSRLLELAPFKDAAVLLTATGSEAIEAALKIARMATGRDGVLGFMGGYHGKTLGSLGVTSGLDYRRGVTTGSAMRFALPFPVAPGFVEDGAAGTSGHDFAREILEHPDFGIEDVAAIVVEAVQGSGGMRAGAPGFLADLRDFTTRHGILLVVDEIFTGLGRTGTIWACEHEAIVPDVLVSGKALGGGFPLGAVVAPRRLADAVRPLQQTSTFSANPVACAAGNVAMRRILDDRLAQRSAELGGRAARKLAGAAIDGVSIEVSGRGLMLGVRLRAESIPQTEFSRAVDATLRAHGVVVLWGGAERDLIKLTPSLVIEWQQLEYAVDGILEAAAGATG